MERDEAGHVIDWDREIAAHPVHAAELIRHAENLGWANGVFTPSRPLAVGDRVGGYELTRYLGGGMGEVYAARDPAGLIKALDIKLE